MLDKYNIIITGVSETVEKIPTNAPLRVLLCTTTAYKEQTDIETPRCLPTRMHPV